MNANDNIVHMVWIGGDLSLMSQLSIKLWQKQNIVPHIWSYNSINNLPNNVVTCDANEIMPKESLFTFQGIADNAITNNGHGSYAHWSDIFQLTLLKKYGGWYSQLDLACLKLPQNTEYYFAKHVYDNIVQTSIMRVPKNAIFLDNCLLELHQKINKDTATRIEWLDSMRIIGSHVYKNNLGKFVSSNYIECGCHRFTSNNNYPSDNIEFLHWCNSMCGDQKKLLNNKQSFYYKLLQQENLI